MTPDQLTELNKAARKFSKAKIDFAKVVVAMFPEGSVVKWKNGNQYQFGRVDKVFTTTHPCVRVNGTDGKQYTISDFSRVALYDPRMEDRLAK